MAGANAVSEFVSLSAAESFAIEYWPLELYKLSLAPPPGELQGKVAFVTGAAGGIGRAVMHSLVKAGATVVALRHRRGRAPRTRSPRFGDAAISGRRRRDLRAVCDRRFRRSDRHLRRHRHRRLQRGHRVERADRRDDAGGVAAQPGRARDRLLPGRPAGISGTGAAGHRRLDCLRRLQERGGRGPERVRLLDREGRRAASRAVPGGRGRQRRDPGQHRQPRRGSAGFADLGFELAERARRRLRDRPGESSRSTTASGRCSASTCCRRTSPARCCTSPLPPGRARATGNLLNVDGGVVAAFPRWWRAGIADRDLHHLRRGHAVPRRGQGHGRGPQAPRS